MKQTITKLYTEWLKEWEKKVRKGTVSPLDRSERLAVELFAQWADKYLGKPLIGSFQVRDPYTHFCPSCHDNFKTREEGDKHLCRGYPEVSK